MRKQNTASDRREPKGSGGLFHAVSLSGGKDSTALLLLMIERGMPIDAVIWADTGMEFPEMYGHIAKVDESTCSRNEGCTSPPCVSGTALNISCWESLSRESQRLIAVLPWDNR